MFDRYQREIHYLRLSVTDLCNLRCRYCMPDGVEKLEREAVLTYEEFLRLAALFAQCGIDTVRVTGGEPLVRKNVAQLVAGLKATPGIRRVTLTTNAVLLAEQLSALLDAGLDSVNISLDTLRPEVFRQITARDDFAAVQAGLQAALESGISFIYDFFEGLLGKDGKDYIPYLFDKTQPVKPVEFNQVIGYLSDSPRQQNNRTA